jgi:pterin-4a-carbinolamine dehydratase
MNEEALQEPEPHPLAPRIRSGSAWSRRRAMLLRERLAGLPHWQTAENHRALTRNIEVPDARLAAMFASFATEVAGEAGVHLVTAYDGRRICLALTPARGPKLTKAVLKAAARIGR